MCDRTKKCAKKYSSCHFGSDIGANQLPFVNKQYKIIYNKFSNGWTLKDHFFVDYNYYTLDL